MAFGGSLFTSSGDRSSISSRIWVGDGFDAFEIENFLVDALDLSRVDDPAIEDARLVAGFFLVIADGPAPGAAGGLRARTLEQDRGSRSSRRRPGE